MIDIADFGKDLEGIIKIPEAYGKIMESAGLAEDGASIYMDIESLIDISKEDEKEEVNEMGSF